MSKWFFKDGKKYIFNSKKFTSLNTIFGITPEIKREVDESLKKQSTYLKSNFVELDNKKFVSFFDMSKSSNLKPKQYYGEMFNKVNALREYAKYLGFTDAVFMTITPPSYLKPLKQINIKKGRVKMVDNPRFAGLADYVSLAREYESNIWRKFLTQRIFKEIKSKYGERIIYMRTYEPMIDGTPHIHIVAFVPPEFKDRFVRLAKGYFSKTRFDIKTDFKDDVGGVVAYILKYILKSFSDSRTNKLDDVGYWYAYHGIRRFTTSRTLIPLKIFRLINSKEGFQDLYKVTKMYKKDFIQYDINLKKPITQYTDFNNLKSIDYSINSILFFEEDEYEPYFRVLYQKSSKVQIYSVTKDTSHAPKEIKRHEPKKRIPVEFDNEYFVMIDDKLIKITPTISKMGDYQLFLYYKSLDPEDEKIDLKHYGLVQNECIERNLVLGEIQPLNNFNLEIGA